MPTLSTTLPACCGRAAGALSLLLGSRRGVQRKASGPVIPVMSLRLLRFSSMMCTAVTMTASFAHLLELSGKMRLDRSLYVMLHRTLYWNFGRVGGMGEILAVLTSA